MKKRMIEMDDQTKERLNIPYIKLKFHIIFPENSVVPKEKVSALRGGMGEMLLQQNCVMDRDCEKCMFEEDCIVRKTMYTQMKRRPEFMKGNDSVGYLLECEDYHTEIRAGGGFFFYLTLFGKNIVYFSQYLQAFYRLGMSGLGKYAAKFYIAAIVNQSGKYILHDNEVHMEEYQIHTVYEYAEKRAKDLKKNGYGNELVFHTPLCLKYQGQYIREFCTEAIFAALFRRVMMLDYFVDNYMDLMELSTYPTVIEQKSFLYSVDRFSSTHFSKVTLKGIKGRVRFDEIPGESLLYVLAGELLHIGKNTSFGFGRYTLQ